MLTVSLVPILEDNYVYVLSSKAHSKCLVIDPGDFNLVDHYLEAQGLTPESIWITHFHSDHIKGALLLKEKYQCRVIGPTKEADKIEGIDQCASEGDSLHFLDAKATVLELPGHTLGHIAYWFESSSLLFCGDVLFSLGCGYLFEGTYEQMWNSLQRIRALPSKTLIYCGHEYTLQNIHFALSLEPNNSELKEFACWAQNRRDQKNPTIPMLLEKECLLNPFLKADNPKFQQAAHLKGSGLEVFKALRIKKNGFQS